MSKPQQSLEILAKNFIENMAQLYLVQRDIEALLLCMHTSITWLGTGSYELSQGIVEARQSLEKELLEYNGSFTITYQELFCTLVCNDVCVVYGTFRAAPQLQLVEEQNLHISAVCLYTDDGIKLMHCNLSRPDTFQPESSYYSPPSQRKDNETLRGTLENREKCLQNLTRNIPGGVHQCLNDANLTLVSMSDSFLDMFGYTEDEINEKFDRKFINMLYPEDQSKFLHTINKQLAIDGTIEAEIRVVSKNNGPIWILDKGRLLDDGNNDKCFYCVLIEITQRKQAQEQLRLSLERHKIILDQATDIIFEWDIIADTLEFSANWRKKFGYDPIHKRISRKIPLSKNVHREDIAAFIKIMRDTAAGVPYSEAEFRISDINDRYCWCRIRASAQFDINGHAIKAVGVITDISTEKEERLALIEQAQKDSLTGLYNKSTINAKVEKIMAQANNENMQALLILDVDHFKLVNDTYGHLCGDTLLSDISDNLKRHFRASDLLGRIGGDEFLIYLPNVLDEASVKSKVETMQKALAQIKPAAGAQPITCSVGAAVFPHKEIDFFSLYRAADYALYQQKSGGRNGVSFYSACAAGNAVMDRLACSAVSEIIDSEPCSSVEQKLAQYTFQMLYQSINVETAVNQLLEIVGQSYSVSRVYIFESSQDGLSCDNTFEWCAPNISPEMHNLQNIRYKEDLGDYLQNFNEDGVFYCHDIRVLNKTLYNVLQPQGIRSLLQCAVLNKGQFKGYVGFDECKENCLWSKEQIRSLTLVANVLSVFLIKLRLEQQIEQLNKDNQLQC